MAKTLAQREAEIDALLQEKGMIDELRKEIAPLKALRDILVQLPLDAEKIGSDQLAAVLEQVKEGGRKVITSVKPLFIHGAKVIKNDKMGEKKLRPAKVINAALKKPMTADEIFDVPTVQAYFTAHNMTKADLIQHLQSGGYVAAGKTFAISPKKAKGKAKK